MRYAALKSNDTVDCESGICVSYWCQGCPIRCPGCHNKQTWDFEGGIEADRSDIISKIILNISKNEIVRNFSVLGGEPLCEQNLEDTLEIIKAVRIAYKNIKISLWTGYTLEHLTAQNNEKINEILSNIDLLIDGPFILEQRDIILPLRGSKNQKVREKINGTFVEKIFEKK